MKFQIGDWEVEGEVDEDNHLTLYVRNKDETEVHATGADIAGEQDWAERFTTDAIEAAHQAGVKPSGAIGAAWPSMLDELDALWDFAVDHFKHLDVYPVEYQGLNGYVYRCGAVQSLLEYIGPIRGGWGKDGHS